jgi:GDPmannose 4,6-dehydratase
MPRALITGITGQDGSYLAELLLDKGYEVHGVVRENASPNRARIEHLCANLAIFNQRLFLHTATIEETARLRDILISTVPDEVYHLAGQSHVGLSFEKPEETCEITALGAIRLLELVRALPKPPRFFHPSSSEIFGRPAQSPQDESTPHAPMNPYGCAKAYATQMVSIYRQTHGLFACNAILYNHESPRRGENFVTQKICRAAAAIKLGRQAELLLGDTTALRDWSDARDFVRAMWLMLQQPAADDYVLSTGTLHSVQDVVEIAFGAVQLDWRQYVRQDAKFMRPAEPQRLLGNPAKARRVLGWEPQISFQQMIEEMVQAELKRAA